ncbi:MAG: DUF1553 domain-containing protein [Bacteroidetes bacterium]|nr:MAG: DUF1553 domain-containing protein [Bacteroidota bacterium]
MISCSDLTKGNEVKGSLHSNNVVPDKVDFNFHVKPILSDRCFTCHGPDEKKVEAGLAFHMKEKAFAALGEEKDHFAIIPGDVENSTLIHRIFSEDADEVMPPPESNLVLLPHEKEILKKWIAQGAEWKQHWAFTPPKSVEIPTVRNEQWASNDIDKFILQKLEERGLNPSDLAQPEKILRRLSFDLTGLPPSLDDIEKFRADPSDEQYENFVETYLNSDAYAERMASDWLDLARYADTHGYQDDLERIMWPWRDWVIHAYQKNMPYDQFVTWQLAGDLLPNATKEQIVATAFNRNHKITQEGGVIPEEYRAEYVTDRTNTFGTAFLGLTLECAKCHDHKYDPISQKEYFQLFSYFNNIAEKGLIENYGDIPKPYINITQTDIEESLAFINNIDSLEKIPLLVMKERDESRETFVLDRGLYDKPTEQVEHGVPSLGNSTADQIGNDRLALAKWLFEDDHPLTSRVLVNRIWMQLFDRGLVHPAIDFGNQGALPTHPELMDFLAVKFREEGWDLHKLIKYIVMSSTYRQSARQTPELRQADPENKWLARAPRARLTAEMIRDHALCISDLLVREVGGPSVKPYQPPGLWNETTGGGGGSTARYVQDEGEKNYRRSLYTFWKRTVPPPNMMTFDTPSRDLCAAQRENTSTPLQALVLLNDPQFLEACMAMAFNAMEQSAGDSGEAITQMFTLATSRAPSDEEFDALLSLYEEEFQRFHEAPEEAKAYLDANVFQVSEEVDQPQLATYTFLANTIFNLDETIRKN